MASSLNTSRLATSLIALFVFQVTFNPLIAVNAQLIPGLTGSLTPIVGGLTRGVVTGVLNCPSNTTGPLIPLGNVTVSVRCSSVLLGSGNGNLTLLGTGITDITGFFNISLANITNFLSDPLGSNILNCIVNVPLPLNSAVCTVLNTATGDLRATVQFLGTFLTATLGLVRFFLASTFRLV